MQMLAVVILGNEGKELNKRSQPDPPRSFPNKRSGRWAKCSHLWQPWNIRRTIAGFHCKQHFTNPPNPAAIIFHCRIVVLFVPPPNPALSPLTDPESMKRAVIQAAVLWNHPLATMFFSAIRPYRACGLQRYPVIGCIFLQLVSTRDAHPPPGKAPCQLPNWLWLHKIATCVRSFKIYDDQKCHWKSWSAILGCNCILLITISG